MKNEVVSYIEEAAESTENDTLHCKFVLIVWSNCLHFVVGPIADFKYHANLVERFCNERSVPTAWLQKPDVLEVVEAGVRVLGGGHVEINRARRRMKCYGVSKAYGVFNAQDMSELIRNDPFFADCRVSFAKF